MKWIKNQYRLATDYLFRELIIYFFLTVGTFVLLTIFSTYLFGQNPELTSSLLSKVVDKFQGITENGEISLIKLFINNLQASVLGVLVGLVPFLFLPLLGIFTNAAVLSLGLSGIATSLPMWKVILLGILPHGIFELTGVFLCYAMGISICWNLTKKIVGQRKHEYLRDLLQNCFRVTVLIVLPLLIVAALVETYITVQLVSTFM